MQQQTSRNDFEVKGFTLIEMLVTIAIIGILSAIALATYTQFVAKARRAEAIVIVRNVTIAQKASMVEGKGYQRDFASLALTYSDSPSFAYIFTVNTDSAEILAKSKNPLTGDVQGCNSASSVDDAINFGAPFQTLPPCQ